MGGGFLVREEVGERNRDMGMIMAHRIDSCGVAHAGMSCRGAEVVVV